MPDYRRAALALLVAKNKTGYRGVSLNKYYVPGQARPYQAQVTRGGKIVHLGRFATAEEAALSVARSPEGRAAAAAQKAAAVAMEASMEVLQQVQACPSTSPASPSPTRRR